MDKKALLLAKKKKKKDEVPPRLELGSLDSKSKVLTITPRDPATLAIVNTASIIHCMTPLYLLESRIVVA